MLYPALEEELRISKGALNRATSDNLLILCKHYLDLLAGYRHQLYDLQKKPNTSPLVVSNLTRPELESRKAIRQAIETTTSERNRVQTLLLSFTTISAYEAVEIFNLRKHKGHNDWELRSSGVKFHNGTDSDLITIQEAVDLASLLRREDHIAQSGDKISTETR
ncbi:MAG TPA: hypothetical protein VI306_03545 [Pyrinomonadaceae bacterium]